MDYLKESIQTICKESEAEKEEIISFLNQLLQVPDDRESSNPSNYTQDYTYVSEICKYVQTVHHKLTEIKFELKKFLTYNKPPIYPLVSERNVDSDDLDIESLKTSSMKIITKLDEYLSGNGKLLNCKNTFLRVEDNYPNIDTYSNIYKTTLDRLSDHTKEMLKDITTAESNNIDNVSCGHFPYIEKNFPEISKSCYQISNKNQDGFSILTGVEDSFSTLRDSENKVTFEQHNSIISRKDDNVPTNNESGSNIHDIMLCEKSDDVFKLEKSEEGNKQNEKTANKVDGEQAIVEEHLENDEATLSNCNESTGTHFTLSSSSLGDVSPDFEQSRMENNLIMDSDLKRTKNIGEILEPTKIVHTYTNSSKEISNDNKPLSKICDVMKSILEFDESYSTFCKKSNTMECCNIITKDDKNSSLGEWFAVSDDESSDQKSAVGSNVIQNLTRISDETSNLHNIFGEATNVWDRGDVDNVKELQNNNQEQYSSKSNPLESFNNCDLEKFFTKPLFSAEEKILKLGLEDRRTRFENTRQIAHLPNLRLQPSVSDSEKMRQIENQGNKFEIQNRRIPSMYATCVFSHVESPTEFYIHLNDEESQLIDRLNEFITQQFQKSKTLFHSKFEAFENVGRFCTAFVKDDKIYYRVEVIDWLFDKNTKLVLVQLVDYGNKVLVHYKHLRPLTKELCLIPKIAVKCYLPFLFPRRSTKFDLLTQWPSSSIEALRELSGLCHADSRIYFKICYIDNESDKTAVDMYKWEDEDMKTIGELLIDLGHAVQIILPEDDPCGVVADDEEINRLEQCNNINEVVLGYDPKDEGRICKFSKNDGTCFKGKNCKLEHRSLLEGGYTTDQTLCYANHFNDLVLPKPFEYIQIRFTTFLGPVNYYINLMNHAEALKDLEKTMNNRKNSSTFEMYTIMPAHGEIVLVRHWTRRWLRAKVIDHLFNEEGNCSGSQVFMVDYGDIIDAPLKDIRHIRREYLDLPFQAVECILHNYEAKEEINSETMEAFFYDNMVYREFVALVVAVSDSLLCLTVFFKDRDIGDILAENGFLMDIKKTMILPSPTSLVAPG